MLIAIRFAQFPENGFSTTGAFNRWWTIRLVSHLEEGVERLTTGGPSAPGATWARAAFRNLDPNNILNDHQPPVDDARDAHIETLFEWSQNEEAALSPFGRGGLTPIE